MNLTWLYVGGMYGAAVWLARRCGVDLPRRVALLFYLLVLVWLLPALTTRSVLVATDVEQLVPPWTAAAPPGTSKYTLSNNDEQDVVMQLAPWAAQVQRSWRSLRVPLWNPLAGCGMPLAANVQSAAFSPLRLLAIPLPLTYLFACEAALKLLVALTFTYLFCRRCHAILPSVIGALSFGFSGWMIVWLGFGHATTGAFLPAVLYQLDLLAENATFRRIVCAAALGPIVFFGGQVETAAHMAFYAAGVVMWTIAVRPNLDRRRYAIAVGIAAIAAVLLAAPLLAPVAQAIARSARYADPRTSLNRIATPFSDFPSMVATVQPAFFGKLPGRVWGPGNAETMDGFAGLAGAAAWFALALGVVLRRDWRSRDAGLVVATLFVFALMDDWPLVSAPFRAIFAMANNHRVRLPFAFLAAVMLAAVVDRARTDRRIAVATLVAGAVLLLVMFTRIPFPDAAARSAALHASVPSMIAVASLGVLLIPNPLSAGVVAVALFGELWVAGHAWNRAFPRETFYPRTPLIEALARLHQPGIDRIAGIGAPLFPNTQALFGFEDARVHDPMAFAQYQALLRATVKGYDTAKYYAKIDDPDTPVFDLLGVRWVVTEKGVTLSDGARYRIRYDGTDGRIWENLRALPRFFIPDRVAPLNDVRDLGAQRDWSTAFVSTAAIPAMPPSNGGATIRCDARSGSAYVCVADASTPALVVASLADWPGWRIRVNGRSVDPLLVDAALVGFVVPAGRSNVTIDYFPASFVAGVALALFAGIALALLRRPIARIVNGKPAGPAGYEPARQE